MRRTKLPADLILRYGFHGQRAWTRGRRRFVPYCTACHATHDFEEQCPHVWDGDAVSSARLVIQRTRYFAGDLNENTPETRRFLFVRYLVKIKRLKK